MKEASGRVQSGIRLGNGIVIPSEELVWKFTPSGGPGGQHANKANTRVELRFDIESSQAFSEAQRRRLMDAVGSELRIVSKEERSQARNRDSAIARLSDRLTEGLKPPSKRYPTRPTMGSKQRRLQEKKRQSDTKVLRSKPTNDD